MSLVKKLQELKNSLTDLLKKQVLLENEINRKRHEVSFYATRVDVLLQNIRVLQSGEYIVSLNEYKLVVRDYYYNRGSLYESQGSLKDLEKQNDTFKDKIEKVESEMDFLIKNIENRVVIPFRRVDVKK